MLLACTLAALAAATEQPSAQTTLGPVFGKMLNGAQAFLGVPYAADTGGKRRFQPPASRPQWREPRQATSFGAGCVQSGVQVGPGADTPTVQSEDCLNVNVYAPAGASEASLLPVLVFIHGGGFSEGWNDGPCHLYDASMLAADHGIVVFVPNYRIEALGFLTLPSAGIGGNLGLLDQRFALTWVRDNAKAFGGDPSRVTLGGQSAGAMSVGIHMAFPGSRGLFSRAIMNSNVGGFRYRTAAEQEPLASAVVDHAGCLRSDHAQVLPCLQALTAEQIRAATVAAGSDIIAGIESLGKEWEHLLDLAIPWAPIVGTPEVPKQVFEAFAAGEAAFMPLLEGTVMDEILTFLGYGLHNYTKDVTGLEYSAVIGALFPGDADKVEERYPSPGLFESAAPQISRAATDFWFKCASQSLALHNTRAGHATYNYRFGHRDSEAEVRAYEPAIPAVCQNHSCHSTDLPFVLGSSHYCNVPITAQSTAITTTMTSLWSSFVRGEAPSAPGVPAWPAFDAERRGLLLGDSVGLDAERSTCEFWDGLGYPRLGTSDGARRPAAAAVYI